MLRFEQQSPFGGHRVACIEAQVHQYLLNLGWICPGHPQVLSKSGLALDSLADYVSQQADRCPHEIIEACVACLQNLAAGQGQALACEHPSAVRLSANHL